MTNSPDQRLQIYEREAAFFDEEALDNRSSLEAVYGGYGVTLAREQMDQFAGDLKGRQLLEYGCGNGENLLHWSDCGASAIGIELSQQSVARANQLLARQGNVVSAVALPMNAEKLGFQDGSFDVITGTAILHHLDLNLALPEIYRVLKPGGVGTFLEARGTNWVINLFRKLTPSMRTEDEHPLVDADFQLISKYFDQTAVENFYLTALLSFVIRKVWRNEAVFIALNKFLTTLDRKMIDLFPWLERLCWIAVIQVKKGG